MEITPVVRMVVYTDLIEELKRLGHYHAVSAVTSRRTALANQIAKAQRKRLKVISKAKLA